MVDAEKVLKEAEERNQNLPPAAETKEVELTDDIIEKAIQKKYGVSSDQLVKKGEDVKVLTPEEVEAIEKETQEAAFKTGIEKGWFDKGQYDNFLLDSQKSEVERAREKFIADNPEMEDAGEVFDETFKVNEDDELEDGENKIPNKAKIAASKLIKKIADEELEGKYKNVKGAVDRYKQMQQEEALVSKNTAIVSGVLGSLPPKIETEVEGVKFSIAVLPEDIEAAAAFANKADVLTDKELSADDLKTSVATYLLTKNLNRLLAEVKRVSSKNSRSATERGAKGLEDYKDDVAGTPLTEGEEWIKQVRESGT